jgi:hypothetical protein
VASPVVAATNESITATAGTNHVVSLPAGIVAEDLIIVCMGIGSVAATINAHADYIELMDEGQAAGLYIAYRWALGGETNPTFVSSASTRDATITYRITGAIDPATQAPQVGTTAVGSSVNPNPPSVSVTGGSKDILAIALFSRNGEEADDDTWVTAAPASYTNLLQKACGVAGTNLAGMIATAERQVTTATEDPGTFTCATGGWRANTIVIHPAPVVPMLYRHKLIKSGAVGRASRW